MSQRLIARSEDLSRLQQEGFDISTRGGVLAVRDVPYLTKAKTVERGTLVSHLDLADDQTVSPVADHVIFLQGETPCRADGTPLPSVINENIQQTLGEVEVNIQLSAKPTPGGPKYRDYHHKVTNYARLLGQPARTVTAGVSARTHPVNVEDEEESVFRYVDNASSRAGLEVLSSKLAVGAVAIVGLGGTGSYILDLLAKTPIGTIHLYDGDRFHQHNAFRAPGAPTNEQLAEQPKKVRHFGQTYSAMRENIVEHPENVEESNVEELREMDFVFLSIDHGPSRAMISEKLGEFGVGFIDTGLGVKEKAGVLTGLVRTTTVTPARSESKRRLPATGGEEDDYTRNIQIAELNAINAILAVIRWKKLVGFYGDLAQENHSLYAITSNHLINTDTP